MTSHALRVGLAAWLVLTACSKDDASPVAADVPTVAPPTSAAASAAASATAARAARALDAGAAALRDGAAACGEPPLAPCPLQAWMTDNAKPAILGPDYERLEAVLNTVATFAPAPPDYPNWASIARDGADAARVQDLDAVKAACRSCHKQYKDRYRKEMRERPLTTPAPAASSPSL